jgi:hypothetical protein
MTLHLFRARLRARGDNLAKQHQPSRASSEIEIGRAAKAHSADGGAAMGRRATPKPIFNISALSFRTATMKLVHGSPIARCCAKAPTFSIQWACCGMAHANTPRMSSNTRRLRNSSKVGFGVPSLMQETPLTLFME